MRTRCLRSYALWIVFGTSISIPAQEPSPLVVKSEISVGNEKATDLTFPTVTDVSGNIYIRYSDGQHPADAISKITPAGKKLYSLNLANVPHLAGTKIIDFSVSDSRLLVLAREGGGLLEEITHVVAFGLDGAWLTSTKIDADIHASQIAALSSNRFVLAGRMPRGRLDPRGSEWTPKVVILDNAGQLVETIRLENDVVPQRDERIAANGAVRHDKEFEESLAVSTIATGDDGNVYLMRYGRSGLVFVISPDGAVAHRFALETPSDSLLEEIKVANHRIAALFMRKVSDADSEIAAVVVRTYDADSGKLLSSYLLDQRIPHLMAAYDGNAGFTFIGPEVVDLPDTRANEAGRLRIFQAGPR